MPAVHVAPAAAGGLTGPLSSPFATPLPGRGGALAASLAAVPPPGAAAAGSAAAASEPAAGAGIEGPATARADPFAPLAGVPEWHVDGISDQNLAEWAGPFMRADVSVRWRADGVRLARYVVPWDVASDPAESSYLRRYRAWYAEAVGGLGLVPMLALSQYPGGRLPASGIAYRRALAKLLALAPVRYLEAWNEPNGHPLIPPHQAASYLHAAARECAASGCTVIAGDLLDSPNMASYEASYLAAAGPWGGAWGVHPYRAVRDRDITPVRQFLEGLPGRGTGARVWVTEVGAYACKPGARADARVQAIDASWLVDRLLPALEPAHAVYYGLLGAAGRAVECPGRYEDTKLFVPAPGGDIPRAAAARVFDGRGLPAAYTGAAVPAGPGWEELTGRVVPDSFGPARWRFLYGPGQALATRWRLLPAGEAPVAVAAAVPVAAGGVARGGRLRFRLQVQGPEGSSDEGPVPGGEGSYAAG